MLKFLRLTMLISGFQAFLIATSWAQAPSFVTGFSNSFGGSGLEDFFAGAPALDGGFLLTGLTNSYDGDINPTLAFDTANIFVAKCNSLGIKEWTKTFGGNDYDKARYIMQDNDSNILIVGGTHSSDGDITYTHGNGELFVLKLDPSGNTIWMKQYGGTGYEGGRMIQQLPSGDYLVTGYTTSHNYDVPVNRGVHDGWLMKLDVDGNIIWSQTYGGSGEDRMRSFISTPDGGFMFFGGSSSNDFQVSGNNGGYDYWIGKVDSLGNHQWSKLYGGSLDELAYHIIATSDGNYLLTGATYSNDGDVTGFHGQTDGWLIKIDPNGNLLWQKCFGGSMSDRLNRSFENADGNIVTFGFSQSSDYDLTGDNTGPSNNFWLARLDDSQNIEWNYCTGGNDTDLGEDMFFIPSDSSYVLMGDSKSVNGSVLNNHGNFDFWIVKLTQFTSLEDSQSSTDLSGYYDYENQKLIIETQIPVSAEYTLTDGSGKIIEHSNKIQLHDGKNEIDLEHYIRLATGAYLVRVFTSSGNITVRFMNPIK